MTRPNGTTIIKKIKTRNKIKGKRQVEKVWRRKMKERP